MLIETFVKTPPLHRQRLPRLRLDPRRRHPDKPKKDIWLRPLRKGWKHTLSHQ